MATYTHYLNYYNRYQRTPSVIKRADLKYYGYAGGPGDAQYFTKGDNSSWSEQQAFQGLLSALPAEVQKEYQQSGKAQNLNTLLMTAMTEPDKYRDMFGQIAQSRSLEAQGYRSALGTVKGNMLLDQLNKQIDEKGGGLLKKRWLTFGRGGGWFGAGDNVVDGIKDFMNGTSASGTASKPMQPVQQTQQQNPSMWNYMLPAMAVGAPLALLGGLGGGRKWGLGLLGAAGLAGLGYGLARQNGWEGLKSVNNFADTVNGWVDNNISTPVSNWLSGDK